MAKVRLDKQLLVVTENRMGMLAEVSSCLSAAGVNIIAINAYGVDNKANFRLVTSDNEKAQGLLKDKGYQVSLEDAVMLELPNQVGVLKEAADKLKAAGIDLAYIYGTTCNCGCDCMLVFSSNNNAAALKLLQA